MTEAEVITIIQAAIVANGNNEITANVLRPVLIAMLGQPNDKMGELSDLDTTDKSNLVEAINEALANGGGGSTFTVHSGTDNPNTTPPASYSLGDWYIRNGTSIYQYNGSQWVPILNPIVYAFSEKDPYFEATDGQREFFIDADTVNVDIWVGGTYQVEGQDYTRDEDTITMTYGLAAGDRVTVRQYKFDGSSTDDYQLLSEKGEANGYTPLDSGAKVPIEFLPDSLVGQVTYQGAWNASTNTPDVGDPTLVKGHYYVASTSGTYLTIYYQVGDWIISNGVEWQKVDNTDAVVSVFGRIGAIVANSSDYSAYYSPIITGGGSTIVSSNLTANRALLSNASGKVAVSTVTNTELGYVSGVTSPIQTQLNAKLATSSYTAADVLTKLLTVDGSGSGLDADLLDGFQGSSYARLGNLTANSTYLSLNRNIDSGPTLHVNQEGNGDIANFRKASVGSISNTISVIIDTNANIISTGNVTATNFILSSDERLKSNIKPIGDIWREFEMDGVKRYGVVAQEIEKTNPELVHTNEEGYKSVAYIDLLCKEMAEKDKQIKDLSKRLEDMEKLISKLIK